MAPSITGTTISVRDTTTKVPRSTNGGHNKENLIGYEIDREKEIKGTDKIAPVSYPNYLPVWDNETERYPPLSIFDHYDHGKDADTSYPDLLPQGQAQIDEITPFIGSEIHGVQLSKLSQAGKDQLARYVAERRVVGASHTPQSHTM